MSADRITLMLIVVAGASSWLWLAQAPSGAIAPAAAVTDDSSAGFARVVAQLDALDRQVSLLSARVVSLEARPPARPTITASPQASARDLPAVSALERLTDPPPDEYETREQEQDRWDEYVGAMDMQLTKESVDAVWSAQAADAIQQLFDSSATGAVTLTDLDCRASLCRVEVVHDNAQSVAAFENQFRLEVGDLLPNAAIDSLEHDDGTISTLMYLARDGYELPGID